jgi:hypothetical protein
MGVSVNVEKDFTRPFNSVLFCKRLHNARKYCRFNLVLYN